MKSRREYRLKSEYGMSEDDYSRMYEEQGGRCYICGELNDFLVVDHCHETRMVRKLLCSTCNSGLGLFFDNPSLLRKAATYISNEDIRIQSELLLNDSVDEDTATTVSWRVFRKTISDEEVKWVATHEPKEIVEQMAKAGYDVAPRSASNWRQYARDELNMS